VSSVMRSLSAGDTMMLMIMMMMECASWSLVDLIWIAYYNVVSSVYCLHCFPAAAFVESAVRQVVL
jgi:hypothetical protein